MFWKVPSIFQHHHTILEGYLGPHSYHEQDVLTRDLSEAQLACHLKD